MTIGMRLAAIVYEAGFPIDEFLGRLANLLRAEHIQLGGALQENAPGDAGGCSAMTLVDLARAAGSEYRRTSDRRRRAAGSSPAFRSAAADKQ